MIPDAAAHGQGSAPGYSQASPSGSLASSSTVTPPRGTSPLVLGLVGIAGGVCVMVMVAIMSRCCCKQRTPAKTSPSGKSPKRTPIKGRRVKYTRQARTEESADKAVAKGRRESPEEEESEEVSEEESEEEGQTVPARHTGTNEQQEDKCEEEAQTVPQKANVSPGPVNGQSNGEQRIGRALRSIDCDEIIGVELSQLSALCVEHAASAPTWTTSTAGAAAERGCGAAIKSREHAT